MKVGDILKKPAMPLLASTSWKDAAEFMLKNGVSAVPVVEEDNKLVGILSEKDLFRALFPSYKDWVSTPSAYLDFEQTERDAVSSAGRTIREVMSKRLITAEKDTPVLKVGGMMVASGIHQVPVIENGKLIGMVGRGQIYNAILKKYFSLEREKKT